MSKGGSFELEIAKVLSLWLTEGERDDLVCKTDTSGGRATVRTKVGKETNIYLFGDLKHSDDLARPMVDSWSIELKTGYGKKSKLKNGTLVKRNWDILDLLDGTEKVPVLAKLWAQCVNDADLSHRTPILIFRRNLRAPCILMPRPTMRKLEMIFGRYPGLKFDFIIPNVPYELVSLIKFKAFIDWADSPDLIFTSAPKERLEY